MHTGSLQETVMTEGFLDKVKKFGKSVAKGIKATLNPSQAQKLKAALKEAEEDGRAYDVKFIKMLLAINKKKRETWTDEDEAFAYLLKKTYIDLPDEIHSLKLGKTINNAGWVVHSGFQKSEINSLRDQLNRRNMRDEIRAQERIRNYYGTK